MKPATPSSYGPAPRLCHHCAADRHILCLSRLGHMPGLPDCTCEDPMHKMSRRELTRLENKHRSKLRDRY